MEQLETETLNRQPEQVEMELTDGETAQLPPLPPEQSQNSPQEMTAAVGGICDAFLTQEAFYAGFKQAFAFTGEITKTKSLPIQQEEETAARKTSDKLYDMARRYSFLNFLISQQSTWFADAALIGVFVYGKTNAVLKEKKGVSLDKIIFGKLTWKEKGLGFLGRLVPAKRQKAEK